MNIMMLRHSNHELCILLLVPFLASSLTTTSLMILAPRCPNPQQKTFLFATKEDDNVQDSNDFDDEVPVKPYRNRSMAWTLRYRKLNPYERARARVISFGHRSKADWDEAVSSGQLGQYVPSYPDEMYAPEWSSWEEWLGLMRGYSDTQHIATNILRLKSLDDYLLFVKSNAKRAEGLRIPVRPDLYYDEWIDEESFFGKRDSEEAIDLSQIMQ